MSTTDLPDLSDNGEIVPDNIRAIGTIYFTAQLEQIKFFEVVDRLVELAQSGVLPVSSNTLDTTRRLATQGMTVAERESFYTRALGVPGGDVGDVTGNTDFPDLWLRFISSISALSSSSGDPCTTDPVAVPAFARAARDVAANASLYGAGPVLFGARRLNEQLAVALSVLGTSDIQSAYAAGDAWSDVESVAQLELGTPVSVSRYAALAKNGNSLLRWLADHAQDLADTCSAIVPDTILISSCEAWLLANSPEQSVG